MSHEEAWITKTAKRSSEVAKVQGGMSLVFSEIIKNMFLREHSLSDVGILVKTVSGKSLRIFAKLHMFIQDGGAHKITWHCKGDGGVL